MAKTIKSAVAEALEDLKKEDFEKFCHQLLDRRQQPRVKRNKVEDKSRLQVTDALVSTFTEEGALTVALEILKQIGCSDEAKELEEATGGKSSKPAPTDPSSESAGGAGGSKAAGGKHFVDKHKVQLIKRVSNIAPILDELQDNEVINQEQYARIRALSTAQDKMRELYSGPLQASAACKDIFYKILLANEKFLVNELREQDDLASTRFGGSRREKPAAGHRLLPRRRRFGGSGDPETDRQQRRENATGGQSSKSGSSDASSGSAGASGGCTMADGKHFVDKHKVQLIKRVSNIAPILDELQDNEVINQEQYDKIRALSTSQDRMRELYSGPLKASSACKDIFYRILLANEKFLVEDLSKK
ncbi:apoptosis-associated speck-like protein containing a CARD [Oreochromis aureus]|nr:apoptosis-associated speck-like protein containing a CARD [Oreochromis aureus]